jgi:hypothetical protein
MQALGSGRKFFFFQNTCVIPAKGGQLVDQYFFDDHPNHDSDHDSVEAVADVQEFGKENSDQFEHQMRINSKAGGNLPDLASRQGNAEVQEDLLTGSGAGSDTDSPSVASHGGAPVLGCHTCKSPAQRGHMRTDRIYWIRCGSGPVASPMRTKIRLQSDIVKPKIYTDGTIRYVNFCCTGEPENLTEALSSPKWKEAMENEITTLHKNKTWHLVPPKQEVNLIDCKWAMFF